jgi:3,4-dihydroxy-2-butanone 4-phosphate synthase
MSATQGLTPVTISPVEDIVADMKAGRIVILVDEEDRENEGDLVLASDHVTPEAINFMARFGRGLICLTLTRERCEYLKLPPMAARNGTVYSTAFTVSIEAAEGVTTGISAADRSRTIEVAVAKATQPTDLVQPGHVFPLQAVDGGVLMRVIAGEVAGHKGPGSTQTPITIVHATLSPGAELRLPWRPDYNSLIYTLNGHGTVGDSESKVHMGQLAVLTDGDVLVIKADQSQESRSPTMDVLILGGEPIRETVAWMGPFVMNTKAEVLKAFDDFQKGLLGTVPAEHTAGTLNRSGDGSKLSGDIKGVHNTPTEIEESGSN